MSRDEKRVVLSAVVIFRKLAHDSLRKGDEAKYMQFSSFADLAERKLLKR